MKPDNKTLHTNRRPAFGSGLSVGLFNDGWHHHVTLWAAVGELGRCYAFTVNGALRGAAYPRSITRWH